MYFTQIFNQKLTVFKMVPYLSSRMEYKKSPSSKIKERMNEIIECIQKDLSHHLVGYLYIFYQDPLLVMYIKGLNLQNNDKLKYIENINDTMSTLFFFANKHLQGHVVMIMNADTYIGEGFEKLNLSYFRQNKVSYVVSR